MALKLHIDNWISKAEPDYYTMFIKAWIPFNAWYCSEFDTKKDDVAIKRLVSEPNKVRNRIVALLRGSGKESKVFKQHLACLQKELVDRTIQNYNKPLTFDAISLDDYFPGVASEHHNDIVYKAIPDKEKGYRVVVTKKDNSITYMDKTFNPYKFSDLEQENQFIALPNKTMKEKTKKVYMAVDPKKPISLISKSRRAGEFILLDTETNIKVIADAELISKATIQIIYALRCLLFHGELDPTSANHEVYEHAFHIMKTIIKELK